MQTKFQRRFVTEALVTRIKNKINSEKAKTNILNNEISNAIKFFSSVVQQHLPSTSGQLSTFQNFSLPEVYPFVRDEDIISGRGPVASSVRDTFEFFKDLYSEEDIARFEEEMDAVFKLKLTENIEAENKRLDEVFLVLMEIFSNSLFLQQRNEMFKEVVNRISITDKGGNFLILRTPGYYGDSLLINFKLQDTDAHIVLTRRNSGNNKCLTFHHENEDEYVTFELNQWSKIFPAGIAEALTPLIDEFYSQHSDILGQTGVDHLSGSVDMFYAFFLDFKRFTSTIGVEEGEIKDRQMLVNDALIGSRLIAMVGDGNKSFFNQEKYEIKIELNSDFTFSAVYFPQEEKISFTCKSSRNENFFNTILFAKEKDKVSFTTMNVVDQNRIMMNLLMLFYKDTIAESLRGARNIFS